MEKKNIVGVVKARRLRWLEHVKRTVKSRMPKIIMIKTVGEEKESTVNRKVEDGGRKEYRHIKDIRMKRSSEGGEIDGGKLQIYPDN